MAKAISWCPRQTPKTGLGWGAPSTLRRLATVCWQSCGSPGPLLMKSPSKSVPRQKQSHRGDTNPCGSQRDRPKPYPAAQQRCSPSAQPHQLPKRVAQRYPEPTDHHPTHNHDAPAPHLTMSPAGSHRGPPPEPLSPMTSGYDDAEVPKLPVMGQDVVPQGPRHQPRRQPLLQIPPSPLQGPGSPWPGPPHLRCPGDGPREPR